MSEKLKIARFTLHYRAQTDAVMPRHKCNTLRSAFGPAITRTLCGGEHHKHSGTLCSFARLFDGQGEERLPQLAKVPPYVFECSDTRPVVKAGSTLRVVFLFVAPDQFSREDLEKVWAEMGRGLARPENMFVLEQVEAEVITEADILARAEQLSGHTLTVEFTTPLLIRKDKKSRAVREPSFADLVQFAWQRAWALGSAWGDGCPDWAPKELIDEAVLVKTVGSNLSWIDWGRQSRRQGRHVDMGGILGSLEFHVNLAVFLPLLAFVGVMHLGAGATTGNGKLELSTERA